MEKISKLSLEFDRRPIGQGQRTESRLWLRMDAKDETGGMDRIAFLLLGGEICDLFSGKGGAFVDIAHHLSVFGESWTFFDLHVPSHADAGRMDLPYRIVTMPAKVVRILREWIDSAMELWDHQDGDEPIKADFSEDLETWAAQYGRGKGSIKFESNQDDIEAQIDAQRGEESFDRSILTVEQIARNTTQSRDEIAPVRIMREHDGGFLWSAGRMHGGIINHGTDTAPDWSVHT